MVELRIVKEAALTKKARVGESTPVAAYDWVVYRGAAEIRRCAAEDEAVEYVKGSEALRCAKCGATPKLALPPNRPHYKTVASRDAGYVLRLLCPKCRRDFASDAERDAYLEESVLHLRGTRAAQPVAIGARSLTA